MNSLLDQRSNACSYRCDRRYQIKVAEHFENIEAGMRPTSHDIERIAPSRSGWLVHLSLLRAFADLTRLLQLPSQSSFDAASDVDDHCNKSHHYRKHAEQPGTHVRALTVSLVTAS